MATTAARYGSCAAVATAPSDMCKFVGVRWAHRWRQVAFGWLTTHMACDTLERPVRFLIAPGQSHDILAVPAFLKGHRPKAVLADRAYDANSR